MYIPERMAHLERHGGIPIPWSTPIIDGKPHFRATDPKKHNTALRFALCGTCGTYITAPYRFLVAPLCLAAREVFGTPNHDECATAAFTLCPYQVRFDWKRHPDAGEQLVPYEDLPPKPTRLGIATVERYSTIANPANKMLYAKLPDEFTVEWWSYVDGLLQRELVELLGDV